MSLGLKKGVIDGWVRVRVTMRASSDLRERVPIVAIQALLLLVDLLPKFAHLFEHNGLFVVLVAVALGLRVNPLVQPWNKERESAKGTADLRPL